MTTHSHPLVEQRLSLPVHRLGVGNATEEAVAASVLGGRDVKRDDQEHSKDNKGKDPLQGNDLDSDLSEGDG